MKVFDDRRRPPAGDRRPVWALLNTPSSFSRIERNVATWPCTKNCEGHDPPRLPATGPGRAGRRQLCRSAAVARRKPDCRDRPARRPTSCILIWMDGGPTHYETFDPKPDAPARSAASSSRSRPRSPACYFSQHMTRLAGDRRQAGDRPLDLPQPGQPRRRQPLHDDRRAAADPGRLRRVRQLSSQPGLGRRPTNAQRPRVCRPTSRCPACRARAARTSWARSTRRSSSPTTRTARSFRVRDVALPRGPDRRPLSRAPRLAAAGRSLPADHRQGGRRSGHRRSTSITSRATT